jgi:hypothetical protein
MSSIVTADLQIQTPISDNWPDQHLQAVIDQCKQEPVPDVAPVAGNFGLWACWQF